MELNINDYNELIDLEERFNNIGLAMGWYIGGRTLYISIEGETYSQDLSDDLRGIFDTLEGIIDRGGI